MTNPPPANPSPAIEGLCERLRADAAAIRSHVPDDGGSFASVAVSRSDINRRTVAGPLHADLLTEAATAIEALSGRVAAYEKIATFARHDALCGIIGGYGYCTCGLDDARHLLGQQVRDHLLEREG